MTGGTETAAPVRTDLVLVGGGHTHVIVLKRFGMRPEPGVRLTLIAKELAAPYSGMVPGLVAGLYRPEECHIDLPRLATFAGARLIHGEVTGIDPAVKTVTVPGQPPIAFDLLSLDVGITPRLDQIEGAAEYGFPVKPVSTFWPRWADLVGRAITPDGPRRFAIVGGGAAGFELTLGTAHDLRLRARQAGLDAASFSFTLVAGSQVLTGLNERARRHAYAALREAGVVLVEDDAAVAIGARTLRLASGRVLEADATVLTTGAAAPGWLNRTGLALDEDGFVAARSTLQALNDDDVFAVGDCSTVLEHPRPKAGVFAVRQGRPLADNLRRRLRGKALKPFRPQKRFLMLLNTADGRAIAARGPFAARGKWVLRWKDYIDRRFMRRFSDLPDDGA